MISFFILDTCSMALLGDTEMMIALSAFHNWMKRGQDKRFLSQLACKRLFSFMYLLE
jgi:hypothetical protein